MYTQTSQKCGECRATGEIMKEEDRCKTCKGEKIKSVDRELEVSIDAGVPHEHDYIFTGESDEYVKNEYNLAWNHPWRCLRSNSDQEAQRLHSERS